MISPSPEEESSIDFVFEFEPLDEMEWCGG